MVFAYFDFSNGLYELLERISSKTDTRIQVIFQHPSPSPESKQSFSSAGYACAKALLDDIIFRVDFVFDYEPTRNTWDEHSLFNSFLANCSLEIRKKLFLSQSKLISDIDSSIVDHPVFGDTTRLGWAKMRRGTEQWLHVTLI